MLDTPMRLTSLLAIAIVLVLIALLLDYLRILRGPWRNGSIVLLHAGDGVMGGDRSQTVAAAEIIIKSLRQQGFRLVIVEELLTDNGLERKRLLSIITINAKK